MTAEFLSWHHVPSRGWVAEFASKQPERDLENFKVGAAVEIEGYEYFCVGTEVMRGLTMCPKFGVIIRGSPKHLNGEGSQDGAPQRT